ncbi:MAG TPA: hypothetical protein VF546_13610 [Pyrinomonadaceae bacterium]|jgi:thioredoxin-related protein
MDGIRKLTDLLANLAIIVVAILLSVVLVKNYLLHNPPLNNSPAPQGVETRVGERLALSGVEWSKNGRTLLLALSTTCHFCSDSAPFYRQLIKERGGVHLVAVLPQPVAEGQKYLDRLGLSVDEVKQAPLASLGVSGTPTLFLIDNNGTVLNTWFGQLPAEQETAVLEQVRHAPAQD